MSFGTLISGAQTFEERTPGEYHLQGLSFADPTNMIRLRPGTVRKDGLRTCGITRLVEKDVTEGGDTVRENAVASLNIVLPNTGSFSAVEADAMAVDISNILTVDVISQMLQGKF